MLYPFKRAPATAIKGPNNHGSGVRSHWHNAPAAPASASASSAGRSFMGLVDWGLFSLGGEHGTAESLARSAPAPTRPTR